MLEFSITAMTCGHCVSAVTQAVKQLDPQATVQIDLPAHAVRIESTQPRQQIESALAEAGYTPD